MKAFEIADLVPCGRLTTVRPDGWIRYLAEDEGTPEGDVFLIFPDDRVFLVKIRESKTIEGKTHLRFEEPEVPQEVSCVRDVRVMLSPDAVEADEDDLTGWTVMVSDQAFGEVTGMFFNGAHWVLEVELPDGAEVLVPLAGDWIASRDEATRTLQVPRAIELLGL